MYAVEYRRFYLRDLEYVMVWPSRWWLWRLIVPAVVVAALGVSLWLWANAVAGEIFSGLALAWAALELALGPTANSRLRTTGATIDLPLVKRTRRARKVLAKIDAAVSASGRGIDQPASPATITSRVEPGIPTRSEASASASITAATETNGS
jgi:hypothetical protein